MNPTRWIVPAAALAGALALAACSGGGGTPAAMPQQADMGGEPSSQPPTGGSQDGQPVSLETRARLQIADPERTARGIGAAAGAQPRFGSVTQSSNAAAGVTTDRARAAFANGRLTVTVARQGAAELTLDSADAAAIPGGGSLYDLAVLRQLLPGAVRTVQEWAVGTVAGSAGTLSYLSAISPGDDQNDWLAQGYWLHMTGSGFGASPSVTGAQIGAFVDGPELRTPPETLPGSGTATYRDEVTGLAVERSATGSVIGRMVDIDAMLIADFAGGTISGCIGCARGLRYSGTRIPSEGEPTASDGGSSNARIRLGNARVTARGEFQGSATWETVSQPGVSAAPVESQTGRWGGKFSNRPVATGEPRVAAGTFAQHVVFQGGGAAGYVGSFLAGKR